MKRRRHQKKEVHGSETAEILVGGEWGTKEPDVCFTGCLVGRFKGFFLLFFFFRPECLWK